MTDKPLPPFSRRLRELRDAAGLTQQQLAVAAELSVSLVAQMEAGKRSDPCLTTLTALARVLGTDLNTLGCFTLAKGKGK